jgi:hypothetical protein
VSIHFGRIGILACPTIEYHSGLSDVLLKVGRPAVRDGVACPHLRSGDFAMRSATLLLIDEDTRCKRIVVISDRTKLTLFAYLRGDFVELAEFFFKIDDAGIVVVDRSLEDCHFLQFVNYRQNLFESFAIHRQ